MTEKLAYEESIADLWEDPQGNYPRKPETRHLFLVIAGEAHACVYKTDWDVRIKKIENVLSVIKDRMKRFWEQGHQSELDKVIRDKVLGEIEV